MFDSLTDRLEKITGRLRNKGRLTEADLDEALAEIRIAFLEADVALDVVRAFVDAIRVQCAGAVLSKSLTPGQQVIKAVHEQLIAVLGGETLRITYASRPPTVVVMAGLQGSGKTTTSAKLARWWRQQGRNPLLVGADLQRPAAVEQLRVLGLDIGVDVFSEPTDPVAVAIAGVAEARRLGRDICIIDTAGRLAVDAELMDEIRRISVAVDPHYTFLVLDAMTGQDAISTASTFHDTLDLDAVILTKLDGDARGGAALSVKGVVGRPIAFGSTGEKIGDFDLFYPERMADRILGMGDVMTLIEQAERTMDADVMERSAGRLMEGHFTLVDFLDQLQQLRKMGSLGGIMKLIPGLSKDVRQAASSIDDREVGKVEAIVRSMTPGERVDPTVIGGSRRARIADGSGTSTQDVNRLLKQFRQMQKMMKTVVSGGTLPGLGPGFANPTGKGFARARLGGSDPGTSIGASVGAGNDTGRLGALSGFLGRTGGVDPGTGFDPSGGSTVDPTGGFDTRFGDAFGSIAGPGNVGGAGSGGSSAEVQRTRKGTKKKKVKGGRVTPPKAR